MTVLIATDKFKGSLAAQAVGEALKKGIQSKNNNIQCVLHPLADGGEGSLAIVAQHLHLPERQLVVNDSLMRPIEAAYRLKDRKAYIEMAAAAGLMLLEKSEQNCWKTTTFGVGELILDAVQQGVKEIYLFIGGSATNDAGMGMATALGYRFYDEKGNTLTGKGANLHRIARIDDQHLKIALNQLKIEVLCDVNSPLYGEKGAAYLYAKQKGASDQQIVALDEGLQHISRIWEKWKGVNYANFQGAGAAGGLGAGAAAFLNAQAAWGIERIMDWTNFEQQLAKADIIITGEGLLDAQSLEGKVVKGVSNLARKHQKPLMIICGDQRLTEKERQSLNAQQIYTIRSRSHSLAESMTKAAEKLAEIGQSIAQDHFFRFASKYS